ncbi:MAG: hypothetical protein ABI282_02220 [Candidatus Baltobacteraceae bacterium]
MMYRQTFVMRRAVAWFTALLGALFFAAVGIQTLSHNQSRVSMTLDDSIFFVCWAAGVFAVVYGAGLGNGSREAARVLWTIPKPRWKNALSVVFIDAMGLLCALVAGVLATYVVIALFSGPVRVEYMLTRGFSWMGLLIAALFLFALYGWSAVVGMLGRRMPYAGLLAYPLILLWSTFSNLPGKFGDLLRSILVANPLADYSYAYGSLVAHAKPSMLNPSMTALSHVQASNFPAILLAIGAVGCGIAIVLWTRSEILNA